MVEVLDVQDGLAGNRDVLEFEAVDQSVLHPPQHVWLSQHGSGGHLNILSDRTVTAMRIVLVINSKFIILSRATLGCLEGDAN